MIKKKIPCRVCGKLFEPCAYCQSHTEVFRWRNFTCSRECAVIYIADTKLYRSKTKDTEINKNKEKTTSPRSNKKKTIKNEIVEANKEDIVETV